MQPSKRSRVSAEKHRKLGRSSTAVVGKVGVMRVDHMGVDGKVDGSHENPMFSQDTYRMTNFRGLSDRTGNRVKHMTKHARAARLQAAKTKRRSHLLTIVLKLALPTLG